MAVVIGDIRIPDGYPHYKYDEGNGKRLMIQPLDTSPDPEGVKFSSSRMNLGRRFADFRTDLPSRKHGAARI